MFLGDIKESKDRILSFLNHYSKELDGRGHIYGYGDIYNLEIDENGEGGFEIKYTISIYSGCRDIDEYYQEEKYIFVSIDFDKGDATLTGNEVMPQREPDLY